MIECRITDRAFSRRLPRWLRLLSSSSVRAAAASLDKNECRICINHLSACLVISQGSLGYAFKFRTPEEIADTAPAGAIVRAESSLEFLVRHMLTIH